VLPLFLTYSLDFEFPVINPARHPRFVRHVRTANMFVCHFIIRNKLHTLLSKLFIVIFEHHLLRALLATYIILLLLMIIHAIGELFLFASSLMLVLHFAISINMLLISFTCPFSAFNVIMVMNLIITGFDLSFVLKELCFTYLFHTHHLRMGRQNVAYVPLTTSCTHFCSNLILNPVIRLKLYRPPPIFPIIVLVVL
jgi:hypothetical protein